MYLEQIVKTKQEEVAELLERLSLHEAEHRVAEMPSTLGFARALSSAERNRGMGLIAEVKKASPSKGLIRADFNPVDIAMSYERAGANCLSVLTDTKYFQGSGAYLQEVRAAVDIPLLRKDFIINERQIWEARLLGADAVLLIAAILEPQQVLEYVKTAASIGLDSLIEVHSREELEAILKLDLGNGQGTLIGINNRNLRTFETSLETTAELVKLVPPAFTVISESGIASKEDMAYLQQTGAQGVLIGEYFMRQSDISFAVNDLMEMTRFSGEVK